MDDEKWMVGDGNAHQWFTIITERGEIVAQAVMRYDAEAIVLAHNARAQAAPDDAAQAAERLINEVAIHVDDYCCNAASPSFARDIETVARAVLAWAGERERLRGALRQAARDGHIVCAYSGPIEHCPNAVCRSRLSLAAGPRDGDGAGGAEG